MQSHPRVGFQGPGQAGHPPQGPRGSAAYKGQPWAESSWVTGTMPGVSSPVLLSMAAHCLPPSQLSPHQGTPPRHGREAGVLTTHRPYLTRTKPPTGICAGGPKCKGVASHPVGGSTILCSAGSKGGCDPRGETSLSEAPTEHGAVDSASTPGAAWGRGLRLHRGRRGGCSPSWPRRSWRTHQVPSPDWDAKHAHC